MKWRFIAFIVFLLLTRNIFSQIAPDTYWIEFSDKSCTDYKITNPTTFLSERAILRRAKQNIPIDETDLPVCREYIDSLKSLGLHIHNTSKWLNGAVIVSSDTALLDTLHLLSFVKNKIERKPPFSLKNSKVPEKFDSKEDFAPNYLDQTEMINLGFLHEQGYKGQTVLIAVLDAGFNKIQNIESLQHIWSENRVLAIRDFVKDEYDMLNHHDHGTTITSIIGANWPEKLHGSGPSAEFALVRTENGNSEYLVEEYNWISGAEYADSLGADIISSSLGYSVFDNPSHDHKYEDLDGGTIPVSKGAVFASRKGILVVNSAGNEGNNTWGYITAPADADSIITVGSVDYKEELATYSSVGPTSDNRIKPDLVAMGTSTFGQSTQGTVRTCTGTSCSTPVITGLAASLFSAFPQATAQEVKRAILKSCHQYQFPDNSYGYGIPNAQIAYTILKTQLDSSGKITEARVFPNPTSESINILLNLPWLNKDKAGIISVFDIGGSLIYQSEKEFAKGLNYFHIAETKTLEVGYYSVLLSIEGRVYSLPFIKINQ